MGVPITSGFMSEWVLFNGALQSGVHEWSSPRVVSFAMAILATVLTSAYCLWMYKRVFYGKTPETLKNVHDSSRYVLVTMGILAAFTLILGLDPDLFYKPIISYVDNLFGASKDVVHLPQKAIAGEVVKTHYIYNFDKNIYKNSLQMVKVSTIGSFHKGIIF
jgi:NADH-quinone oxidoreductase subunit M